MIPQDRTLYLELAKLNPKNKQLVMMYFKNYVRALRQEKAAATTATRDNQFQN